MEDNILEYLEPFKSKVHRRSYRQHPEDWKDVMFNKLPDGFDVLISNTQDEKRIVLETGISWNYFSLEDWSYIKTIDKASKHQFNTLWDTVKNIRAELFLLPVKHKNVHFQVDRYSRENMEEAVDEMEATETTEWRTFENTYVTATKDFLRLILSTYRRRKVPINAASWRVEEELKGLTNFDEVDVFEMYRRHLKEIVSFHGQTIDSFDKHYFNKFK